MGKSSSSGKDKKKDKKKSKKNQIKHAVQYHECPNGGPPVPTEVPLTKSGRIEREFYEAELLRLQQELVVLQEWVRVKGLRVCILFEGRDAAGKGGVIKRMTEHLNPRVCYIVALPKPSERERTQWYFQRYIQHLPAAGEIALFDRSWYNRAGVEKVMGFCSPEEYAEFMRSTPEFEDMLQRAGIILIKYWFSVSPDEQERRFQSRLQDQKKHWKLSDMDLKSRDLFVEYSRAKDEAFLHTDTPNSPWYVVPSNDKRRARLNCLHHLLSKIHYEDVIPHPQELPPRPDISAYARTPIDKQKFVPDVY